MNSDADLIRKTKDHVRELMSGESTGHDWWHVQRVWKNARKINESENANQLVVELAALLHDVEDWKFSGSLEKSSEHSREWLSSLNCSEDVINAVCVAVKEVSFQGARVNTKPSTLEGCVVQDADRLDTLGAIGAARCFAYGGKNNRALFDPEEEVTLHDSFEAYKANNSSSLNHFFEKLLLLKDLMNTSTGKDLALERHAFMEEFVARFKLEWEGKL